MVGTVRGSPWGDIDGLILRRVRGVSSIARNQKYIGLTSHEWERKHRVNRDFSPIVLVVEARVGGIF